MPQKLRPENLIQTACEASKAHQYSKQKVYQGRPLSAIERAVQGCHQNRLEIARFGSGRGSSAGACASLFSLLLRNITGSEGIVYWGSVRKRHPSGAEAPTRGQGPSAVRDKSLTFQMCPLIHNLAPPLRGGRHLFRAYPGPRSPARTCPGLTSSPPSGRRCAGRQMTLRAFIEVFPQPNQPAYT